MKDPQTIATILEQTFNRIHQQDMQGIPILNPRIQVQALGFREYEGRVLGIIITPWLMNVVMLPAPAEDWSNMELGHKQPHSFPAKTYKFMVNEIDGIGYCQTHSLYSPMGDFSSHEQALSVAQNFLDNLTVEQVADENDLVNEELLGKIMRGEETPEIDLDSFAEIEPYETSESIQEISSTKSRLKKNISRRELLRGHFLQNG